jgi:hypothetical protein
MASVGGDATINWSARKKALETIPNEEDELPGIYSLEDMVREQWRCKDRKLQASSISFFAAGHRRLIPRAVSIRKKKSAEQQKLDIIQLISVSRLCALSTTNPTRMPFAQLVIGPPGAGKSTYCNGMHQFLGAIGRKCSIVNLDPANDKTSYPCALDVRDLVTLEEIMDEDKLGPNGGVLYALEELEKNFDWLEEGLKELGGMSAGSLSTI